MRRAPLRRHAMDNLTHTLTGIALSHAGLNRKTRFATLVTVLGANLPDIDQVTRLAGSATYLKYHRGLTHSLLGVAVLAALLGGAVYHFGRTAAPKKAAPPIDGRWLLAACLISTASHLLLDFSNAYGIRPFLPFSGRWYAWDIMSILDPLLLLLLAAGLGLPAVLRLVTEEVGGRGLELRRGAYFCLGSMVVLWGLREFSHRRVLGMLDAHVYRQQNPMRLGAFPSPANPFSWTGVVETETSFYVLETDALADDVDPESALVLHKPEASPALSAALRTRAGEIFSSFARFLWARVEESENGYFVTLQDVRFMSQTLSRRGFVAEIELDKNLKARSESFSFSAPSRP